MNMQTVKRLLVTTLSGLAIVACAPQSTHTAAVIEGSPIDNTPVQGPTPIADRIAIVNTGWGTPIGNSPEYREGLGNRAYRGPRQKSEDEKCTENYLGEWPYRVKQGLIPYAVAYKTPKMEKLFDGTRIRF